MSRIAAKFEALKASGRKALIPYVTAGDPNPNVTVPLMHDMVKAGADIIELGVPFSDPMADGPVIQKASERALIHHTSLRDVIGMVSEFRKIDSETPVVLMGYLNPIEIMGYETFAREASVAGVDGVLTVDLPPEEGEVAIPAFAANGLDPIFLIAPTTTDARMQNVCAAAGGFVYYVSVKGVTGAATLDTNAVADKMTAIRKHTDMPVGVGFGIRTPGQGARIARFAGGVVVGSALVDCIAGAETPEAGTAAVLSLVSELSGAIRSAR